MSPHSRAVIVVLPCEWSNMDVPTTPFYSYKHMKTHEIDDDALPYIRSSLMFTDRTSVINNGSSLWGREIRTVNILLLEEHHSSISIEVPRRSSERTTFDISALGLELELHYNGTEYILSAVVPDCWICCQTFPSGEYDPKDDGANFLSRLISDGLRKLSATVRGMEAQCERGNNGDIMSLLDAGDFIFYL